MNDRIDPSAAAEAPRSRRFSVDLPHRPRRLRQSETMRRHVRETRLHPSQLILPVFVKEGLQEPVEIASISIFSREPSFMAEPLPNARSICASAASNAFSRSELFILPA